ncbi:hypothetical protein ADUPG1_000054 [Aduncisulcus paluster]|uniref:PARP catalytic domain-containing protein n=1 Tax=Aduncisulcus paluster TaxID=2918883 RepID=A0ABQ5K4I0_9EUKA|nr:hypothetical protein ADUPG1_000054 [Aduncisulcus paluster]
MEERNSLYFNYSNALCGVYLDSPDDVPIDETDWIRSMFPHLSLRPLFAFAASSQIFLVYPLWSLEKSAFSPHIKNPDLRPSYIHTLFNADSLSSRLVTCVLFNEIEGASSLCHVSTDLCKKFKILPYSIEVSTKSFVADGEHPNLAEYLSVESGMTSIDEVEADFSTVSSPLDSFKPDISEDLHADTSISPSKQSEPTFTHRDSHSDDSSISDADRDIEPISINFEELISLKESLKDMKDSFISSCPDWDSISTLHELDITLDEELHDLRRIYDDMEGEERHYKRAEKKMMKRESKLKKKEDEYIKQTKHLDSITKDEKQLDEKFRKLRIIQHRLLQQTASLAVIYDELTVNDWATQIASRQLGHFEVKVELQCMQKARKEMSLVKVIDGGEQVKYALKAAEKKKKVQNRHIRQIDIKKQEQDILSLQIQMDEKQISLLAKQKEEEIELDRVLLEKKALNQKKALAIELRKCGNVIIPDFFTKLERCHFQQEGSSGKKMKALKVKNFSDCTVRLSEAELDAYIRPLFIRSDSNPLGYARDQKEKKTPYTKFKVKSALRIENPYLFKQYCDSRAAIRQKYGDYLIPSSGKNPLNVISFGKSKVHLCTDIDEHLMFHGSSYQIMKKIAVSGFDFRESRSDGSAFGKANYFAEVIEKADQYSSPKGSIDNKIYTVLLALNIVGPMPNVLKVRETRPGSTRPPIIPGRKGKGRLYNSVVGQFTYREFVQYELVSSYPLFIVFYKRKP